MKLKDLEKSARKPHASSRIRVINSFHNPKKSAPTLRIFPLILLSATIFTLFYHAYGVQTSVFSGLNLVSSDVAYALSWIEVLIGIVLTPYLIWRLLVFFHELPREATWFNDPRHID